MSATIPPARQAMLSAMSDAQLSAEAKELRRCLTLQESRDDAASAIAADALRQSLAYVQQTIASR